MASRGYHRLYDFLLEDGRWPTEENHLNQRQLVAGTHLQAPKISRTTRDAIYKHAPTIVERVFSFHGHTRSQAVARDTAGGGRPFGLAKGDKVLAFPLWPAVTVKRLTFHSPKPLGRHPMQRSDFDTLDKVHGYIGIAKDVLAHLSPLQADVWW